MLIEYDKNFKLNRPYFRSSINSKDTLSGIQKLLKKISNSVSYDQYQECLDNYVKSNNSAIYLNDNLIKDKEYYLKSEFLSDSLNTGYILKKIQNKGLTVSPEYVDTVSNNIGFAVTLLKIPEASNAPLLKFVENKNLVTKEAKQKCYKDLINLLNMDIVHLDILRHPEVLKIVPNSKERIVCEDWSNLCTRNEYLMNFAPDDTYFDIVKKLHNIIFDE